MKHETIASLEQKAKEAVAYIGDCANPSCTCDAKPSFDYVDSQVRYIYQELSYMREALYGHISNGHLPPIEGAERLSKALKVLGLDGDYEVKKQVIYANDGTPEGFSFVFRSKK